VELTRVNATASKTITFPLFDTTVTTWVSSPLGMKASTTTLTTPFPLEAANYFARARFWISKAQRRQSQWSDSATLTVNGSIINCGSMTGTAFAMVEQTAGFGVRALPHWQIAIESGFVG
jgi:hypothetical protein